MRRALILGGGGAKGAFQVGMLKRLVEEEGLDFQILRGVSVGALNAAYLAQAATGSGSLEALKTQLGALERLWTERIEGNSSVYNERFWGYVGALAWTDSLYDFSPLQNLIETDLDLERLRGSGRDFSVGVTSLVSGRYQEVRPSDPLFKAKLRASAAIPVIFPHVSLPEEEEAYVDGGARNITPLKSAFGAQPDELYVLMTSQASFANGEVPENTVPVRAFSEHWRDNWLGTKVCGRHVLMRTLEILTDEIYLEDISGAIQWNRISKAVAQARDNAHPGGEADSALTDLMSTPALATKKYVKLHVIAPQQPYGEDNSATEFSKADIRRAIDHGYEVACDRSQWLIV